MRAPARAPGRSYTWLEDMTRKARIAQRIAMAAVVGIVAAVFMSSSVLAGVVALATMLFVVIDMFIVDPPRRP